MTEAENEVLEAAIASDYDRMEKARARVLIERTPAFLAKAS